MCGRGRMRLLTIPVVLLAAGSGNASPLAQDQPAAAPAVDRPGFMFGFCLGGGVMKYDREPGLAVVIPGPPERVVSVPSRHGSGGFAMYAGWAFNHHFALGLDIELQAGVRDDQFNSVVGGLAGQYWPTPRFWVKAGIGGGSLTLPDPNARYVRGDFQGAPTEVASGGLAFLASTGVEVVQRRTWTVDLHARFASVRYDPLRVTHLTVQIGVNGYR